MSPADIIALLFGAGFLGGLVTAWYTSHLKRQEEQRAVASIVHAELNVGMWQIAKFIPGLKIFAEALPRAEEWKKVRASGVWEQTTKELKEAMGRFKPLITEFSKLDARSITQEDPLALGRLGPALTYLVMDLYARGRQFAFNMVTLLDTFDLQTDPKSEVETMVRDAEGATGDWRRIRPLILAAAGFDRQKIRTMTSPPQSSQPNTDVG